MGASNIARALGGAVRTGSGWLARCPNPGHGRGRGDRNPSLSIADGKDGRLLLHCFAGCDHAAVSDALRSRGLLSGNDSTATSKKASAGPTRPLPTPSEDTEDWERRQRIAAALWQKTLPAAGTLVETYLRFRLGGHDLPSLPPTLRFHPELKHLAGQQWPAMVAAVVDFAGRFLGVHRTFLARDGLGKAPVDGAKRSLGPIGGGAVWLTEPTGDLQVCEGIETAAAVLAATGKATWAALSTAGLDALVLPASTQKVIICADGDEPGLAAAYEAARRWLAQGVEARIARAPSGTDFLDVLIGQPATQCGKVAA